MKPEKLFHELLGLGPGWTVAEVVYLEGGASEIRIVIEATPELFSSISCLEDEGSVGLYDHVKKRTWRHLNIFQHECHIECRLPACSRQASCEVSQVWESDYAEGALGGQDQGVHLTV